MKTEVPFSWRLRFCIRFGEFFGGIVVSRHDNSHVRVNNGGHIAVVRNNAGFREFFRAVAPNRNRFRFKS